TRLAILAAATILTTATATRAQTTRPAVLKAWTFNKPSDLQGWSAGGDIRDLQARADGLHFEATGTDPILTGPLFDAIPATNNQVVVVEIECDQPVTGELYYTNKTEGRYGGFEPDWMTAAFLPAAGKPGQVQSIVIWPFWERLGKITRLRFDPPTGAKCRLLSIRIEDDSGQASPCCVWDFTRGKLETWRAMYGLAAPDAEAGRPLELRAPTSQGLLLTAVQPFEAASRPILRIRAAGEPDVAFYWMTRESKGVLGTSVPLPSAARAPSGENEAVVDLRTEPAWRGTVTHVGIGPSERGVQLEALSLEPAATASPPAARQFGTARPIRTNEAAYVPTPRPVKSDYDIGVYYFPGWAPDRPDGTSSRWEKQAAFPERDPVLGWYREGDPEVADWHIKWAVENGIRFFIYDWYWRDGKVTLQEGLHDGLLKARYRDMLKFCIMWANHQPFSNHTKEQFIQVADYWVEHYLRLPNYYRVDGKPYVSFFHVGELQRCFGTDEKLADALGAMRRRVRDAGLPDLYIVVCGDANKISQEWYRKVGFDAVTAYNYWAAGAATTQSPYEPFIRAHEDIWHAARKAGVIRYIPLLTSNWDARPWHGPFTNARFGRTTARFGAGLKRMRAFLDETGGKVGIIEAWNEWGEGSYIEPNREFGFGDLEAIRRTFARPGDWPANIAPQDVGLGPYDVRTVTTTKGGPAIVPIRDRLEVYPGKLPADGRIIATLAATLDVPQIETRRITIDDYTLVAGAVNNWMGGNRLWIDPVHDRRNLLPGSFVAGSLRIESRDDARTPFVEGNDYTVDPRWGAFALTPAGRLKPGDHVRISYAFSLRRVDAIAVNEAGRPLYLAGEASADCPLPPVIPQGTAHLANVYRPFNAGAVQPYEVYPILARKPKTRRGYAGARPVRTIEKLRNGEPVTVVCWGDSVTACGEASTPEKCYVNLLESRLRERYPKATVRVVNAGIGGTSTPGRLPAFQNEVLDFRPDLVTLEFVNDMGLPDDVLKANYEQILRRVTQAGADLILITPHFTMPEWMELPHGRGPEKRRGVMFLRRFAEEHNVPLADASKRWEELQDLGVPYETLLRNGINHPDDRGHAFFADELMRILE
ncbi:MAG: glycoside hydrolase family 99-like domain-containing protein, partial [Phycisphaerae bacterium]